MDSLVIMLTIKSLYDQLARLYTWYRKTRDEEEQNKYCRHMEEVLESIAVSWTLLEDPYGFYRDVLLIERFNVAIHGLETTKRGWRWYNMCIEGGMHG